MHYLNRIESDQLNGAIEISAPMVAVAIQGMPAELCSDSFWVAYVTAVVGYAKHHPEIASITKEDNHDEFDDLDDNDSSMDKSENETQCDEDIIMDNNDDTFNSEELVTNQQSDREETAGDNSLEIQDHQRPFRNRTNAR